MQKIKVNPKWFRHETLHTTWVIIETLVSQIQKHKYYQSKINPKFNQAIDQAVEALSEAYTIVGLDRQNEQKKKI